MHPLVLQKSPEEVDQRSADMWSYAMILWELVTREVPFGHLSPMEVGMKVINVQLHSCNTILTFSNSDQNVLWLLHSTLWLNFFGLSKFLC